MTQKRLYPNAHAYLFACRHCDRTYTASRPDSMFCGSNCRQQYHRKFPGKTPEKRTAGDCQSALSRFHFRELEKKANRKRTANQDTIDQTVCEG